MATSDASTRKGMDHQITPPRTAQEKREAVRAAFERRTTQAQNQMINAIAHARNVRDDAVKQAQTICAAAVEQAEEEYVAEMAAAVHERTALMNKILMEL